nr:DUF4382 domain-containing protein [Flavihumibacter sp.]
MKTSVLQSLLLGTGLAFLLVACSQQEDANPNDARIEIRLTDAPNHNIKEVWVEIKEIQINMGSDSTGWTTLTGTYPGVYNLLELTNGRDT